MTPQHVFPPQEQETIYDIIGQLQHYLEQKQAALQEKQRQCDQLSVSLNAERKAHEETKDELEYERASHHTTQGQLRHAAGIVKDLQGKMQPVNEYVAALERQIAHLCSSSSRPLGYTNEVVLVNRAALHALARLAHVEGTQEGGAGR
jgi:chromosome segregation ATPase